MTVVRYVKLHEIRRRPDARPLDQDAVRALAESIREIGLRSPINVRLIGDGNHYELIAGSHRLAATELLGETEILAIEADDDDLHAELATIDENLVRAELSPAERARQTARRKAIYEELHPDTRQYVAGGKARHETASDNLSFAAATAQITGRDQRSIQREASRGEKIASAALDLIRGTQLDTGSYLDQLKQRAPAEQVEKVRHDLAEQKPSAPIAAPHPAETFQRFLSLADGIEALPVAEVIAGSGRQRAVLGQRASGLVERMSEIMEGLSR